MNLSMPICANGHEVIEGAKFCPECGAPASEEAASAETQVEPSKRPGRRPSSPAIAVGSLAALAIVGAAIFLLTRDGNPSDEPRPKELFALTGSLSAPECGGGYEIEFASVEVRDQSDRLIGSGTTGNDVSPGGACEVEYNLDVPKATFYQVEIGTHGGPSYSFAEMETVDWNLELSLG